MKTKEELQLELDALIELFKQKEEIYQSQQYEFNEELYNQLNSIKQQIANKHQELYS